MRRWLVVLAAALALGAVVVAGLWWRVWVAPTDQPAATVQVRPGATLHEVADSLAARGLLRSRRVFLLAARLGGRDRDLHVGTYALPAGASPRDVLEALLEGRPLPVVVTLPEGLEAADMAAVVADSLDLTAADILAAADERVAAGAETLMTAAARDTLARLIASAARPGGRALRWCEGYLAPDTYHFAPGLDATQVAAAMIELQLSRLRGAGDGALTPHALLTLASLVEAEARLAAERATVAAVYHNRLARGMRLEADPTVAFWLGKRGERLLYRDLAVPSPYNTYRRRGLPPGPVLAPGAAAIAAAAAPDTACTALYFVADGAGGHVFSETLAEHEAAVRRYRALMRERRR
jgi:UPF0755 protein